MKILAIETSCDETASAVVENGSVVLSNVIASQIDEHKLYGGIVPEIASRRHCECIAGICREALELSSVPLSEIDAVAVTYAPGLIGALLVGVNFAKGLALAANKPLIPVNHIYGHIAGNYINGELKPPFLALAVSGGHTLIAEVTDYTDIRVIGSTLDDAAGEAFDKAARAMGFPYPGGAYIDKAAREFSGDINKYTLPFPKTENKYDFSFSGLKTAVINLISNAAQKGDDIDVNALAAKFQRTVCEILTSKTVAAAKEHGYGKIALSGGVAANSGLRAALAETCRDNGIEFFYPSMEFCGDNAAMIGCQAFYEYRAGRTADGGLNANAKGAELCF